MSDGVAGIGGVFFRARDPDALRGWYEDVLGVPAEDLMRSDGLVFGVFDSNTGYFGEAGQAFMLSGATVDEETQEQEGIGRFGWAVDPEGNRFELWEPAEGM